MSNLLPQTGNQFALRRLSAADLECFQAYRHQKDLGLYQGWTPQADAEALTFLTEMQNTPLFVPGRWVQLGIAAPDTDALLGDIGVHVAPDRSHAEIGFTLSRQAQGRGIATGAVGAVIKLLFEQTAIRRVLGITDARNLASIRLLERLGMQCVATENAIFRGEPCVEFTYSIERGAV